MSRTSPANRIAGAGACAFLRMLTPFPSRFTAILLVVAIALPTIFTAPSPRAKAANVEPYSIPVSAPPEPFLIHSPSYRSELLTSVLSLGSKATEILRGPQIPAGLENAKMPTRFETAYGVISSLLSFAKPSASSAAIASPPPQPSSVVDFDFDNDGKADIGRWHSANAELKVKNSNGGSYSDFTVGCAPPTSGCSQQVIAPGDFNGDGKTDAAVFNSGTWKYKTSTSGSEQTISWGTSGDIPVAGDYDGDGTTDAAIYRPSTNTWWVSKSSGGYTSTALGTSGDIAVPGDYDGDGKSDLAVYRPSNGYWYINPSAGSAYAFAWGISIDTPVPADYDADGKTDPAVFRPSTGTWYAYRSASSGLYYTQTWGNYGDQPVPGDYDGDNKADYAIWRPTTGSWYTLKSSDSSFSIQTLGVPGDTAVPSAYIKQVGGQIMGDALAAARLSQRNATGGTNLYSQNFSWGTSLVSLPGRAGLDAGFGISYNSLVWTKLGSAIVFDPDRSNASPGFRFGFPTIEPIYYDDNKDLWSYMMIAPSGGRVEFRQTLVTNTYDTADSSYTQLVVSGATNPNDSVENITIKVTTTDGTQMSYAWSMGAYRCTQIKDRNGNYVSMAYDGEGRLDTMTDTLGRVVTVSYESTTGFPSTITQTWKDGNGGGSYVTHTWATLTYTTKTVDTDFDPTTLTTIVGPPDGTSISVLDKITYPDGSATKFEYNGYLQVQKVSTIAADSTSHILNYVSTNLASPGTSLTDCPRFTHTYTKAENFNMSSGAPQEIDVENLAPASSSFTGPNGGETTSMVKLTLAGHPDGLYTRIHYGPSGWKEGLTLATEDCVSSGCTGTDRKRWTWTSWTQDDTGPSYILNPRVEESRVGDPSNTKKTTIDYYEPTSGSFPFGLPEFVRVYGGSSLTTPLKTQKTTYSLSTNYTSRRIVGLPLETDLWEGDTNGTLLSKVTYAFDENGYSGSGQSVSPTQHDSAYGTSFTYRGNLTSTMRWNATSPTTDTLAVTSSIKYNTAGSPISQTDPRGRVSTISYADVWNDSVSRTTYAFPTTVTDPGNNSSTIEYRYDLGANVWARSPTPAGSGNSNGKTTSRTYSDATGRITKEKIENSSAYTRYEYPNTGTELNTYTTIIDVNSDYSINSSDEVLTETLLDGAGRVRKTRTANPGSTGGFTGKLVEYDILGRLKRETVPTEINSSWNPAGDDYRGMDGSNYVWLWNSKEYDWKDRVTRTIPSDSSGTDGKDTLIDYAGCGCSGGQVTTIKGPKVTAYDVGGTFQTTEKRPWKKVYEDPLGRTEKTEIWDLDGAGSAPYSTVKTTFNGRDQATLVRQYSGGDSSTIYQDTTFSFDGHGRLATKHLPEYDTSTAASWTYNPDDTIASVTDPRGAVITYKYGEIDSAGTEDRALLTKILFTSPNPTTIPDPTDVVFTYDAAGNRTYMSDESGDLMYTYDELSRLKSETKNFADTLSSAPSGGYVLSYNYELTGGLKSMTGPFGHEITYTSDAVGRITEVGDGSGPTDAYASAVTHRSFGAIKSASLSATDPIDIALTYDSALRPATYEADSAANSGKVHEASYAYSKDGVLNTLDNQADAKFDQLNKFDFAGRLKANDVGTSGVAFPFKQNLSYDAFNNLTARTNWTYGLDPVSFSATYANNRKTSGGSADYYDSAGNVTSSNQSAPTDNFVWKFDAAGKQRRWEEFGPYGNTTWKGGETTFDGDGRPVKMANLTKTFIGGVWGSWNSVADRYIYSSVTGKKVTSLDTDGAYYRTHVYLGSARIADERNGEIWFNLIDPLSGSTRETDEKGDLPTGDEEETRVELAGLGTLIPHTEPPVMPAPKYAKGSYPGNAEGGCVDPEFGNPMPCGAAAAYQNYLKNLAYTLEQIRQRDNPREPRDPSTWTVRNGDTRAPNRLSRYDDWQTFPDDWIFADNQRHDHPGLSWAFLGRVDDREQWGWEPAFPPDAAVPDTREFRTKIVERLDENGGRCRSFLDAVRKNLKVKKTIEDLFDEVIDKGGKFVLAPDISTAGVSRYGKKGRDIGLQPVSDSSERYTNRAIHELIHRAGVSAHKAFARAGFDSLSPNDQKKNPLPKGKGPGYRDMDDTYSGYFSQLQNLYCPPKL